MSSPSQSGGGCSHLKAGFDLHSVYASCRDKKKGQDPCVEKPDCDCCHCNTLTPEQLAQLSTPSYKIKKEKRESKSSTPAKNPPSSDRPSTSVSSAFQPTRRNTSSESDSDSLVSNRPLLIFLWRRVNCRMNWMPPSPTLTSPSQKSNLTEKP